MSSEFARLLWTLSRKQPAYFRIVPALNLLGKIRQFTLVNTNRPTHFENDLKIYLNAQGINIFINLG